MTVITERIKQWKLWLVTLAIGISGVSLFISHTLITDLYNEEVGKMSVWAEAMRSLTVADETTDLSLVLQVINSNNTIPVVVTDKQGNILATRNLSPEPHGKDSLAMLDIAVADMKRHGKTMRMDCTTKGSTVEDHIDIFYEESVMLRRLSVYPYVQLGVVSFFVLVCILALLASKRAEQNRVWVGLSRETAHQLGTPISSLMAWSEMLKETYPDDPLLQEMDNDVRRLQLIAERFSKIGSAPELSPHNLCEVVEHVAAYFDKRTSTKVKFTCSVPPVPLMAQINAPLFEWVIENLCKNAVDAMQGEGHICITMSDGEKGPFIEVSDTGKGIARKNFKSVFKPGFTTKKRGWGLGLSLAKRIVEEYHHGHIFVKSSEEGKGTTFRIELRK